MLLDPVTQGLVSRIVQALFTPSLRGVNGKKLPPFDSSFPLEQFQRARLLPSEMYLDPAVYKEECEKIFSGWSAIGSTIDVNVPRSYFTQTFGRENPLGKGNRVAIVRGKNGDLNALSTSCTHNGTNLFPEPAGIWSGECPYHGWCYKDDGGILSAKGLGNVGASKRDLSLNRYETQSWGPVVFVRTNPGMSPLSTMLDPLIKRTRGRDMSKFEWMGRQQYIVNCNWKAFVDNYLDGGYHVLKVHPQLARALALKKYGTEVFDFSSLQHAPPDEKNAGVRGGNDVMYWWLFPNLMINIYGNAMDTNIVIPLGPDKCIVIFDYYIDKEKIGNFDQCQSAIKEYIDGVPGDDDKPGAHKTQLQDMYVCELLQAGLKDSSYEPGYYAKSEIGKYHFHKLLMDELRSNAFSPRAYPNLFKAITKAQENGLIRAPETASELLPAVVRAMQSLGKPIKLPTGKSYGDFLRGLVDVARNNSSAKDVLDAAEKVLAA